jgi:tight adherence protein B
MTGETMIPFLFLVSAAAALAAASLPERSASAGFAASVRTYLKAMHSGWTGGTLVLIGILATLAHIVVIGALTENWPLGVALGAGLGPVVVWQFLQWNLRRYRAGFRQQFLPALDIIVRGLRSGMPLIPALQVVHKEVTGPVRAEFRRLLDDLALGLPLTQAVERMATRIPTTEVQFFAAVIGFQARTGGRLSEALEKPWRHPSSTGSA